jgi:hypothetical protein
VAGIAVAAASATGAESEVGIVVHCVVLEAVTEFEVGNGNAQRERLQAYPGLAAEQGWWSWRCQQQDPKGVDESRRNLDGVRAPCCSNPRSMSTLQGCTAQGKEDCPQTTRRI